ncbi:MAG: molybdopterin-guanine dinucleotide biosynthesis protein B [Planctomycetaceae bacterium]
MVPRLHIVGRKNHGKTTLVCELVTELADRGLRVATVKHTHHHHELDTPGKDSHRHRQSGAIGVGILSAEMVATFVPVTRSTDEATRYAPFATMFADCDLIVVEGDLHTSAVRMEVWRTGLETVPYAADDPAITAVISDDAVPANIRRLLRSDVPALADEIIRMFHLR